MTQSVLLGDILYPVSETMKFTDDDVVFLNTSDIEAGKFLHNDLSDPKTLPGQAKKKIQQDDILFSEIRPANKRFAYVNFKNTERYVVSTKLMVLRAKDIVYPKYAYHWLTAPQQLSQLQIIAESRSGTFPQITFDTVKTLKVTLPDYSEQIKIAEFIDAIDEKIELNRRMNETLEQMGQALFRHYFIDNPEAEKWEDGTLEDLFEITMGQSPPGSSYNEDGEGITFYQGRAEFGVRFPNKRLSTIDPKRLAKRGDVLLSVRAPVGDINQADENCCIGRGLAAISSGAGKTSFCYYTCRSIQGRLAEYNSEGTVFGAINGKQLKLLNVKLPPETIIKSFEEQAQGLDEQILNNSQQIQTLTTLRDTLLPRLISGKVKV